MNSQTSLTAQAHNIIKNHLYNGDIVIDATIGNGHDTLFLAKQVGFQGVIFGFDIQQQAIDATQLRLTSEGIKNNIKLFLSNHREIKQHIPVNYHSLIKVITFNLGYLPGSDKQITTEKHSTLLAIQDSLELLNTNGLITIIAYPGHPSGAIECDALTEWSAHLNPNQYKLNIIKSSIKSSAPRLFVIQKL